MKKQKKPVPMLASLAVAAAVVMAAPARADDVLTGDVRLACEAILCLSSGVRPGECAPSLARYFGISYRKWSDTVRGRLNFLNLCPVSSQTPEMQTLVNAMSQGAGRCDAAALNSSLRVWYGEGESYIGNQMPAYCAAYTGHAYTYFVDVLPMYVGTPERGGYWVEAQDYQTALAQYNERIRRENGWWWGQ